MMRSRLLGPSLAVVMAAAFSNVGAESGSEIPHKIIQGLRFDWPTAVICLKNTDSRGYVQLVRPRLSTYARLSAVPEGNLLIATVPPDRMAALLKTIAALDLDAASPSAAFEFLPSTFGSSLEQPEPEETKNEAGFVEDQYVAVHLKPGRLIPYVQMYSEIAIQMLATQNAIVVQGDPERVKAQMELAYSIDVANYDQCVQSNDT